MSFSHQLIAFHWSLSDSKSPQISRTLLSILGDLNNAVVGMVSTRPLISKSSSPCTNHLVTVPSTSITIDITVSFIFHSFFSSQARSGYLSLLSLSFHFTVCSAGQQESTIRQVLFFSFFFFSLDLLVWSRLCDLGLSQNPRTHSGLCTYHLLVWSNLNFLHSSQWITFPTQSCLVFLH